MWMRPPNGLDQKWYVRRWMAVTSLKVIVLAVVWVLCLLTYVILTEVKDLPPLSGFATALSIFVPSLAAVIAKYIHDAGKADVEGDG